MIRVAFLLNFPKEYKGGINYIKNLLYALKQVDSNLTTFLFLPENIESEYEEIFRPYAEIIRTTLLNRGSIPWFVEKVLEKTINKNFLIANLVKKYRIDVVSHSNFFSDHNRIKKINWIPDFQCLHYPELWSTKDLKITEGLYRKILKNSDRVVVSSYDALNDLQTFSPGSIGKASVLQFVSQPGGRIKDQKLVKSVLEKYKIKGKFFYVPNQFWSHKNHLAVLKALLILKSRGVEPLIVTTGLMHDFRTNDEVFNTLSAFVKTNCLQAQVLFLGLIPYSEVLVLFKEAQAIINPSFFEGWSSSVEESKSIGQRIILSDIGVHREQNPENGIYFDPNDENQLAEIMEKTFFEAQLDTNQVTYADKIEQDLIIRTKSFANNYIDIVNNLVSDSH